VLGRNVQLRGKEDKKRLSKVRYIDSRVTTSRKTTNAKLIRRLPNVARKIPLIDILRFPCLGVKTRLGHRDGIKVTTTSRKIE
jgi:hypothetical protein